MSHVTHINDEEIGTWLTCTPLDSFICNSIMRPRCVWHDSFICVTRLIYMCDMTHSYVWPDPFICVTWRIHMCDITHTYVWHDSFICVTWLIRMCDMTRSYVWHDSFIRVTWLIHMCDITHTYVWHDSFICVTWLIHMCDVTRSYVWHDSCTRHVTCMSVQLCSNDDQVCVSQVEILVEFEFVPRNVSFARDLVTEQHAKRKKEITWLIHVCDISHSDVWRDSFIYVIICVTWLIHTCDMTHSYVWHDSFICVTWLIHMCDMTHSYMWHDSLVCVTWLVTWRIPVSVQRCNEDKECVTWLMHMCDMAHSYVWHDSSILWHDSFMFKSSVCVCLNYMSLQLNDEAKVCVTWIIHMCDMTHSYVWHDAFIRVTWPTHTCDITYFL